MKAQKDIEKAKKYLLNEGYGTGTNFGLNSVAGLMSEYLNISLPPVKEPLGAEEILKKHTKKYFDTNPLSRFDDIPDQVFYDAMHEFANQLPKPTISDKDALNNWKALDLLVIKLRALKHDLPLNLRARKGDVKDLESFDMGLNAIIVKLERSTKYYLSKTRPVEQPTITDKEIEKAKELIEKLGEVGSWLYQIIGSDSYNERCVIYDVKAFLSKLRPVEQKQVSQQEIEKEAATYNNSMTSIAEGVWMPKGFIEGAKWVLSKLSNKE